MKIHMLQRVLCNDREEAANMKKTVLVIAMIFVFLLSSCQKPFPDTLKNNEIFYFRVNDSFTKYGVRVLYSEENEKTAKTLVITEMQTEKVIQRIDLQDNEMFGEQCVYITDVTFDGNNDLLIPSQQTAAAAYFQAYVWDNDMQCFVYAPAFEQLANFTIDRENEKILCHKTSSRITSYGMSIYKKDKRDFVLTNSVYWEPIDQDKMHFVEQKLTEDGETTVNDFLTVADTLNVDQTDPKVTPYFEHCSFWDLDNKKWQETFYEP